MSTQTPSCRTTTDDRRGAVVRPVGHERFRSHTADAGRRTSLAEAVATFDELVVAARHRDITDRSEVRAAFAAAVDAIARAIHRLPQVAGATRHGSADGTSARDVGWVLVDRAAMRFTSRVVGTELGRRPTPPHVLASLDRAKEVVAAWT